MERDLHAEFNASGIFRRLSANYRDYNWPLAFYFRWSIIIQSIFWCWQRTSGGAAKHSNIFQYWTAFSIDAIDEWFSIRCLNIRGWCASNRSKLEWKSLFIARGPCSPYLCSVSHFITSFSCLELTYSFIRKPMQSNWSNEAECLSCGDGGMLLLCDFCPASYHLECAGIEQVTLIVHSKLCYFCHFVRSSTILAGSCSPVVMSTPLLLQMWQKISRVQQVPLQVIHSVYLQTCLQLFFLPQMRELPVGFLSRLQTRRHDSLASKRLPLCSPSNAFLFP